MALTPSQTAAHFWALEPDPALAARVLAYKARVRALAGPQTFLDDPPHLTLYLAVYAAEAPLEAATARLAAELAAVTAGLAGWHAFASDPLTGAHSLVCGLAPEAIPVLRVCQTRVVAARAPLRDPGATRARYATRWPHLDAVQQHNVETTGFPYTGPTWQPHVTIASIAPDAWPRAWEALRDDPPGGAVRFATLQHFRLAGATPVLLHSHSLPDPPA